MAKFAIITDKTFDFLNGSEDTLILSANEFISGDLVAELRKNPSLKVINLCDDFEYLSKGYYCSLLAEARGMRCVPPVASIVTLNWKRHYLSVLPELNALLKKTCEIDSDEPSVRRYTICFGRCREPSLEPLARRVFDLFRCPLLQIDIRLSESGKWEVESISPLALVDLPALKHEFFKESLDLFTGGAWRFKTGKKPRYWIAILHNPEEQHPPSNKRALQKFIKAGKDLNVFVELITKYDYASILEYDALFLREGTSINHHTFRFALKAESEGIPCIDDTASIIRCCNKVFQYETLSSEGIDMPKTMVIDRKNMKELAHKVSYPVVLKIPDGSFSRGVMKADTPALFLEAATTLLKNSEIILAQEFVSSQYDWRIGILNGKPLYACKYFMAKDHWQIYNHSSKSKKCFSGDHATIPVEKVPQRVLDVALSASRKIGNGLYGVDLKETEDGRIVIIEVNDNPSLDEGVEDLVLGDELYTAILKELVRKIEANK